MELNKTFSKIEEKLNDNICDLLKKENMSKDDVTILGMAVDILKDISTVEGMDKYGDMIDRYEDGTGMRRGRSPQTGRFVSMDDRTIHDTSGMRYDYPRMSYDERSYTHDGQSMHSVDDRMVDAMERMYGNAASEYERSKIDKVIHYIRNNMDAK